MRKRIFSMLLALCLMLSLLPTAALATGTTSTLPEAKDGVITLTANTTGALTVSSGETVTLDLSGKTLSLPDSQAIQNEGTLTIKDSTGNGKIVGSSNYYTIENKGTLTIGVDGGINNFTISSTATGSSMIKNGWYNNDSNGKTATLTVYGGTLTGGLNTIKNDDGGVLDIQGGKISNTTQYAVMNWNKATISGGEIECSFTNSKSKTDGTAIYNEKGSAATSVGEVTITGGKMTGGSTAVSSREDGAKLIIQGGEFSGTRYYGVSATRSHVEISGGTLTGGTNALKINAGVTGKVTGGTFNGSTSVSVNSTAKLQITGGTFASEVKASYLPLDFECVEKTEGEKTTYTVQKKAGLSANATVLQGSTVASATVDGSYIKNSNDEESVTENASNLTIDAATEDASNVTTSNVTVSANALTSVKDASVSNVAIKTDVGTLTVDKTAWDKITSNATSEEGTTSPVVLSIAKTGASTDQNTPLTYTLTAKAGDEDVFAKASAAGKITVSVPYTKTGTSDPQVYYVSANGSENMNAVYTAPTAEGGTGTLSWDASHFSTYVVMDGEQEAMLTTTSGTTYTTLSEALTSAATSGGAITLLKDATLDNLNTTINSNVILSGKGTITATVATGATTVGLTIAADKSLTLDGVKLIINGTKDADAAKGNNGTALSLTSGSNLKLENGATLELKDLERGIIMPGTPPVNGTVTVDASTLTASGIDGNFSNGGKFVFQNGSTATIDGCGSYGISANNVTVDNSTLTVKNTGYSAIYASDDNTSVIVQNGGKINVSDSGKKLPYTSSSYSQAYSPIDLGYKNNGELTVGKNSSITLTGNNDKDSKENNSIYLSNTATLNNEGTITGEIKTAEVAGSAVRITYLVDGQTYHVVTASPDDGQSNVTFEEPTAPTKSGYRFLGWGYRQNVAVTSGTVTLTPVDDTNTYTFTAQWSKNSSSSGGGVTTYAIITNSSANGTVTVSSKSAAKDATVTITVAPASGYQLDKLTVVDKDGKGVALTDKGNGRYTFTMPASKVEVTATFKQAPVTHVCPAEKYTDVDTTQWYHEGVDYVIANGMMNGTGTNIFEPNATTTRGMIVTILYRLEKEPAAGTSPFTDVDAGQWYAKAVAWAAANGVVNGTSPTTFNPNDPITREQMAAILYRYASFKGYDVTAKADLAGFTDAAQISDYAKDPMAWANKAGLIGGVSATTLQPQGSAIRAQVATILMRFCENVVK